MLDLCIFLSWLRRDYFFQISSDEETNSSTSWMPRVHSHFYVNNDFEIDVYFTFIEIWNSSLSLKWRLILNSGGMLVEFVKNILNISIFLTLFGSSMRWFTTTFNCKGVMWCGTTKQGCFCECAVLCVIVLIMFLVHFHFFNLFIH